MSDVSHQEMRAALEALAERLNAWQKEGAELQTQLVRLTAAVFFVSGPLTAEEQEWARQYAASRGGSDGDTS